MDTVYNLWHDSRKAVVNQRLKLLHCLFLRQAQREPLPHLFHHLVRLYPYVGNVRVCHQGEEVEDEAAGLAESRVSGEAVLLEGGEVGRLEPTHAFDHGQGDLDRGRSRLRIAPEYVAKVNVEEVTCSKVSSNTKIKALSTRERTIWSEEEIIQMSVANSQ